MKLYALPTKIKILRAWRIPYENRRLTQCTMYTRKSIFFTRDLARVQLLKILSRQTTQRKIGNRTTDRPLLGRFIFFHRVVGVFNYSRYKSLERFDAKTSKTFSLTALFFNTLIFVSSTYRVYFIIFFLKSAVFTIKKEPFPSAEKNGLLFIILETGD